MQNAENAITRYLRDSGENISNLAERMGRHPSTLTRALSGERNPSTELAKDIEEHTHGSVSAIEFMAICMAAAAERTASPAA